MKEKNEMIDGVTKLVREERLKDGTVLIGGLERERDTERERVLVWLGLQPAEQLRGVSCFQMSERSHTHAHAHTGIGKEKGCMRGQSSIYVLDAQQIIGQEETGA